MEKVEVVRREWFEVWKQEVFGSVSVQIGVLKLVKVFSCTSELRNSLTKLKDYCKSKRHQEIEAKITEISTTATTKRKILHHLQNATKTSKNFRILYTLKCFQGWKHLTKKRLHLQTHSTYLSSHPSPSSHLLSSTFTNLKLNTITSKTLKTQQSVSSLSLTPLQTHLDSQIASTNTKLITQKLQFLSEISKSRMSGYFTHWRDMNKSQNSYCLKKVFSEAENRVLCRLFGEFKYNVLQAEVNKWAKQIREFKGVQGVLTEQREELGYLLKMAKAYFARKATEKLYSVISLTHDIDDIRFGSRYQRKLLKITLNKWKIFDKTKKEIMVRLLKLIKSKERVELKITFAQYKNNISEKYLSTQSLITKIRKLKMQRVFTAWKADVDKQKYKRRLGRKLVRRLRRRLLLEGVNKWVGVIRHMKRGEEEQVEYQQLDQWSHSEEIKRLKLNFFQDQSKQKLELENRKINKQIKYILVNSVERHQRAVCLTYFSKWKDNATKLKRLQHSTSRLDSILKQSELRKSIQIWSSNIQ